MSSSFHGHEGLAAFIHIYSFYSVFYFPHQSPNNTLIGMLEHSGFPIGQAVPHLPQPGPVGLNTLGPHLFYVWCVPSDPLTPWALLSR